MKRKIFTLVFSVVALGLMAAQPTSLFVSGNFNSWALADPAYQLTYDATNMVYFTEITLPAGENRFKLYDGDWANSYDFDHVITLTAPTKIGIYARQSWKYIVNLQDTVYITGNGVGAFTWGPPNMVPMNIDYEKNIATTTTNIGDWGQTNIYRLKPTDKTVNWDGVWSKSDFSGGNFVFYETTGAVRTIVFDFKTYEPTLAPQERFDLAYTLDGTTWKTAPFIDDANNADLLNVKLTLPADITLVQYGVKYSQDGATYPANVEGFTVLKNIDLLTGVTAGVENTLQISRASSNPNWDLVVATNTAVNDVKNNIKYTVYNSQIVVNAVNSVVEIFAISGQKLASSLVNGSYTYTATHAGVYILRSNGASYKVVIK